MKNSIFNIKKSGRKGNLLAVLLTVTASLLYCSSAWAYNYVETIDCGLNVQLKTDGSTEEWAFGSCANQSGTSTCELGVKKEVVLNGFWTKLRMWTNSSYEQYPEIGSANLIYADNSSFTSSSNYNAGNLSETESYSDNKIYTATATSKGIRTYSTPGDYHLYMYIAISGKRNESSPSWRDDAFVYNNGGSNYQITFTIAGWSTASGTQSFSNTKLGSTTTVTDIDLGTHYGTTTTATAVLTSGNTGDFSITSCDASKITVSFTPTALGNREATITITDAYSKTRTLTVSGKGISSNTPTVLIAKNESVEINEVTLSGYLKYTGCYTISDYGFVYAASSVAEPTVDNTKKQAGTDNIAIGTTFTSTFTETTNGTYNYRAYIKAGDTYYYSTEVRQFTINTECSVTEGDKSTVLRTIGDGTTQGTEYAVAYASSVTAYLKSTTSATTYTWACNAYPDGATVQIASTSSRNTTVTVNMAGTYTFTLSAQCTDQLTATESDPVTLYVCAPAASSTLTLDGYTANVVCEDEGAVAELVSESGYTYTLYRTVEVDESEVTTKIGSQPGTGKTISWSDIQGVGTFTVTAYQTGLTACESISGATVGTATQTVNKPALDITSIASAMSYQPVTISKVSASSTVDTEPTWLITSGTGGYLLNSSTGLSYDGEAVANVILKAAKEGSSGYVSETYTVQGSATKTVAATSTSPKKTCSATDSVSITVSPATEDCD